LGRNGHAKAYAEEVGRRRTRELAGGIGDGGESGDGGELGQEEKGPDTSRKLRGSGQQKTERGETRHLPFASIYIVAASVINR
jgi:hypothetical protein